MFDQMTSKRMTRCAITTFATLGLLVAGCSSSNGAEPGPSSESPNPPGLNSFDACAALKPEELRAHGLPAKGEPTDQGIGEVGCNYENDELILGVLKAEDSDKTYWQKRRNNFDNFEVHQVGSHEAIAGVASGGVGLGVCRQIILAGGGSVITDITFSSDQRAGKDPCAKAMEFAEMIEPRLPE